MYYTDHGFNIEMPDYRYKTYISFGSFLVNISYWVGVIGRRGTQRSEIRQPNAEIETPFYALCLVWIKIYVLQSMTQVSVCCNESALESYKYAVIVF